MGLELYRRQLIIPETVLAAIAAGGGTGTVTLPTNAEPYTDRIIRIRFDIYVANAGGGPPKHLVDAGAFLAQALVTNKNNVCAFPAALAGSSNPMNASVAQATFPVASDAAFGTTTAVITINGANQIVLTVTNNNAGNTMDAIVVPEVTVFGAV